MVSYGRDFELFVIKVDRTGESILKSGLFRKSRYIDTGGDYKEERKNYDGIIDYENMIMGKETIEKLHKFYKKNPVKVKTFMKRKKK